MTDLGLVVRCVGPRYGIVLLLGSRWNDPTLPTPESEEWWLARAQRERSAVPRPEPRPTVERVWSLADGTERSLG